MFNFDERYYESVPFKVTILPKTIELKLTKQFKYFGEQDPILENKSQQIKPEVTNQPSNDEKKEPLQSANASNIDKNKYASATDIESNKDIETKVDKNKSCNRCI